MKGEANISERPARDDAPVAQPVPALDDMVISTDRFRRWMSWIAYLLFIALVAGAFIWLFMQFTASWKVATGVVVFLLGYMAIMAWWAQRSGLDRDDHMSA